MCNFEQAISALKKYGKMFASSEDKINRANINKLLAIAYFNKGVKYDECRALLDEADKDFKDSELIVGQAVCAYAKAYFTYSLKDPDDNEKNFIYLMNRDEAKKMCD